MKKQLRSGYTTGACAAAAAKAAVNLLLGKKSDDVEIPFPDGRRVSFNVYSAKLLDSQKKSARASIIKDAGDDPDVTNGAEIVATVQILTKDEQGQDTVILRGGEGVGQVTRPGLAVAVGEPAINPVPREMIEAAVLDGIDKNSSQYRFDVEISVPKGAELAQKTLNERLGILGGISILGTTGIVRPVSAEAWTATITASMQVAEANGCREIVLSTGRTSEKAIQELGIFSPQALVMMGDYLEFALKEAGTFQFTRLHLSGMWAKIVKAAMRVPQTHVRFGALEVMQAIDVICELYEDRDFSFLRGANTAREIYDRLVNNDAMDVVDGVCREAKRYHEEISGLPVTIYLVHHNGKIVVKSEG